MLLQGVHLTGESDVNSVTLSESLKEFVDGMVVFQTGCVISVWHNCQLP